MLVVGVVVVCGDRGALVVVVCLRWKGGIGCVEASQPHQHNTMHATFINTPAAVSLLTPLVVVVVAVALHNEPNTQSLCCCIEVPRQQRKHWHLYVQTKPIAITVARLHQKATMSL